jgi:Tetratricopeptide repeat
MASRHSNLGSVLRQFGDLASARPDYERALEIGQAALGHDHRDVSIIRGNLDYLDYVRQHVAVSSVEIPLR